jgi:hypothetical protein
VTFDLLGGAVVHIDRWAQEYGQDVIDASDLAWASTWNPPKPAPLENAPLDPDRLAELRVNGQAWSEERWRAEEAYHDRQQDGDGDPVREVQLIRASTIEPEHVEWLEDGLMPLRVVTLVTGLDGVGKSTALYDRAARATRGQLPGRFHREPVDVVVASSEDHPASVIVPRLTAAGADLDRVHIVKLVVDGLTDEISLPVDLPELAARVGEVGARLVIIDPLIAHMPLAIDTHKAQHVRSVLAPLTRLAEDHHLAIAAVVHFNGAPSTDVRTRISGSKALRDASRSVLVCGTDPSDESRYVLVQDKNSFGPKSHTGRAYRIETRLIEHRGRSFITSGIVWLDDVEIDSRGLLSGPGDPEERSDLDEAVDFLRGALKHGPQPAKELKAEAKREGHTERTLARARRKIGVIVTRSGFQGGSTWALPSVPTPLGRNGDGRNGDVGTNVVPQRFPDAHADTDAHSCQPQDGGTNGDPWTPFRGRDPVDRDLGAYCSDDLDADLGARHRRARDAAAESSE